MLSNHPISPFRRLGPDATLLIGAQGLPLEVALATPAEALLAN